MPAYTVPSKEPSNLQCAGMLSSISDLIFVTLLYRDCVRHQLLQHLQA